MGSNSFGQLGDGTTTTRKTPVQVSGLTGVTDIAGGYFHTIALKNDGTVRTWGYNVIGALGLGDLFYKCYPVWFLGSTLGTQDLTATATQTAIA